MQLVVLVTAHAVQMAKILRAVVAVLDHVVQLPHALYLLDTEHQRLVQVAAPVQVFPLREHIHQLHITSLEQETVQIRLALVNK